MREQLLCTLSKSEWVDKRDRERGSEGKVGAWGVKLREVKQSQRVDETLGVRREG